jgi:hypothetical protein
MYLIFSTTVSLFFTTIPEHIDISVSSSHEFKNSVVAEIWLLHSQPFTNNHFHLLITVESAASQMLLQRPKQMEVRRGQVRTIGLQDYSIWLSDSCAICRMLPLPNTTTYRKTKCLIKTKLTGYGMLLLEWLVYTTVIQKVAIFPNSLPCYVMQLSYFSVSQAYHKVGRPIRRQFSWIRDFKDFSFFPVLTDFSAARWESVSDSYTAPAAVSCGSLYGRDVGAWVCSTENKSWLEAFTWKDTHTQTVARCWDLAYIKNEVGLEFQRHNGMSVCSCFI